LRLKKININNIRDTLLIVLFWLSIIYPQIEITHNITIDDGLAYSQVTCAYKDYRGIMWFGTSAGLSEWNSVKFKNYYRADGLPSTFISDICEDDSNHLYIATNKGLVYKKGRKFQYPIGLPQELHSEINKIFITRNDKFYILTEKTGVWEKRGNSFFYIKNKSSHQNIIPISITERESGEILIGTKRNGIYKISDGKLEQIIYQNIYSKYPIVDLLELNTDSLFVALQGLGIAIITQDNRDTFITTKNKLPSKYINNLFLNNSKEIYASTANGIAVITNGKVSKIINNKNGLHNEFVITW
jgi:ligand-binding sensor domain-containing protein